MRLLGSVAKVQKSVLTPWAVSLDCTQGAPALLAPAEPAAHPAEPAAGAAEPAAEARPGAAVCGRPSVYLAASCAYPRFPDHDPG